MLTMGLVPLSNVRASEASEHSSEPRAAANCRRLYCRRLYCHTLRHDNAGYIVTVLI